MKKRKSYKGRLNGVASIWCDRKPEGLELEEEITFYTPDEGKIFKKGDDYGNCVIIRDGIKIEDFEEVEDTHPQSNKEEASVLETPVEE